MCLVQEHAGSKINNLDADFPLLFHQYIFRFDVGVYNIQLLKKSQGEEDLYGKGTDILRIEGSEIVALEELVEVAPQNLCDDADMSSKNYEIFYSENVLPVLNIFLLYAHKDVDLIQSQVHLFPTRPDYLHSHIFGRLVVEGPDNLPEGSPAQPLQQFIPVSHLLVLPPHVPPLKVILPHSRPDTYIIDRFLIYQLDPLVLRQDLLVLLDDLLAGQPREGLPQPLELRELAFLNDAGLLLVFLQFIRCSFLNNATLIVHFNFAATSLPGSANFPGGVDIGALFLFFVGGSFEIIPHGFGGITGAFGAGRVVKEVGDFWAIPGVRFVVFIEFDF